jgi:hypothetical protein
MNLRIIEARLRREYNLPESFVFFRWVSFPNNSSRSDYVLFTGAQCPLFARGPKAGTPNYRLGTNKRTLSVSSIQAEQWGREYEAETGNCRECEGKGERVASVGLSGTKYGPCSRCGGSGKAKGEVA